MSNAYLYHEKQDAGLCGVHCLNNLLQGSFFNEIDLMQIARKLDQKERELMAEAGTDTTDFMKFVSEDSGNVALDGNFSIQVLSEALGVWGLQAFNVQGPHGAGIMERPEVEGAFICNLQSHWLAIRKLGGDWWDLNSLYPEPQYKSELYLGIYLKQLQITGYTIYVVRGKFPNPLATSWNADGSPQGTNWVRGNKKAISTQRTQESDNQLEKALQESLREFGGGMSEDEMLQAAIQASMSQGGDASAQTPETEEDAEMQEAIKMSLGTGSATPEVIDLTIPDEPENTADACTLLLQLPDGKRVKRRFNKTDKLGYVYAFVTSKGFSKFKLMTTFPKKYYEEKDQTVEQLGLCPQAKLIVAPL